MKKDYTYIGCVLDRSGSMSYNNLIEEARGGFNKFLKEQKELSGTADIEVTIFDDFIETFYKGDINDCPELSTDVFYPRGMTALYDAMGKTIGNIGDTLKNMKEDDRPDKVIILTITDGQENSSKELTYELLSNFIKTQREKYNWEFIFMASDLQSVDMAKNIGIFKSFAFANSNVGTKSAYNYLSKTTSTYRNTGNTIDFKEDKDED